jgi:hypothetical protein
MMARQSARSTGAGIASTAPVENTLLPPSPQGEARPIPHPPAMNDMQIISELRSAVEAFNGARFGVVLPPRVARRILEMLAPKRKREITHLCNCGKVNCPKSKRVIR